MTRIEKTTFRSATPFSSLQYGTKNSNSNNLFQEPIFLAHRVSLFIGNRGLVMTSCATCVIASSDVAGSRY